MEQTEDLEKLAEICLLTAKTIKNYLASNGLPQMSFDQNGPAVFPEATPEIQQSRMILRDITTRLHDLVAGPEEPLITYPYAALHDLSALRYVQCFNIAEAIPLDSTISYPKLADTINLDVYQLRTIIRQLIPIHIFCEPRPDHVAHTATSKLLLNKSIAAYNAWHVDTNFPCSAKLIEALEKWGHGSQEPTEAAFNLAYKTDKPMFLYLEDDAKVRERFSRLISYVSVLPYMNDLHTATGFDWASLGGNATIVDLAGNMGACSIPIAQTNPAAQLVVQDLPAIIKHASNPATTIIPADLQSRITFMAHDFFDPQPVKHASAYFLRMVCQDHSDKYAVDILKQLAAVMKPNYSRLILCDIMLPPVGVVPVVVERFMRVMDMEMMMLFNSKEREYGEWIELLAKTDPRLKLKNVVTPPGSAMSFLEVILEDSTGESESIPITNGNHQEIMAEVDGGVQKKMTVADGIDQDKVTELNGIEQDNVAKHTSTEQEKLPQVDGTKPAAAVEANGSEQERPVGLNTEDKQEATELPSNEQEKIADVHGNGKEETMATNGTEQGQIPQSIENKVENTSDSQSNEAENIFQPHSTEAENLGEVPEPGQNKPADANEIAQVKTAITQPDQQPPKPTEIDETEPQKMSELNGSGQENILQNENEPEMPSEANGTLLEEKIMDTHDNGQERVPLTGGKERDMMISVTEIEAEKITAGNGHI